MPWKETDVVELRTEFVLRAMGDKVPFVELCREYGISAKTGYKWKERFFKKGVEGLQDQSRRPKTSPTMLDEDEACRLIKLKLAHPDWGGDKIHCLYRRSYPDGVAMSSSTVKRLLEKVGLVKRRRVRHHQQCGRIESSVMIDSPNKLWTVDFKGWWYSTDRRRIEPLTVRDAFSRYVLRARALSDCKSETVRREFEELFQVYGLPEAIRSDNGSPFACTRSPLGLTRLSAWWVALGINLDRIAPGHPEQNGGHERMHRDIAMEVEGGVKGDAATHKAALEVWRNEFNEERPHEALGMRTPAEVYSKSPRRLEPGEIELEYPLGYLKRRVGDSGDIKIASRRITISTAVSGWDVGLKPTGRQEYVAWFGPLCMGRIDLETESFAAAR